MSDPTMLFDLFFLNTLTGTELGPLRTKIPAADALAVLQAEQAQAITGEHGVGVVVFLRPSGEAEPDTARAVVAALRAAAIDLLNQLTVLRYPDESTLWRLGGQPLQSAYAALSAALADYDAFTKKEISRDQ